MTLDEDILGALKWPDNQVLKLYTTAGERLNLDQGKRKYWAGMGLWAGHLAFMVSSGGRFFGALSETVLKVLGAPDFMYNWNGLVSTNERDPRAKALATKIEQGLRRYNSLLRFPSFTFGVGLVTKVLVDVGNYVATGEPINQDSYDSLQYGLGLICLASSMYIKEMDPKLLEGEPAKELVRSTV